MKVAWWLREDASLASLHLRSVVPARAIGGEIRTLEDGRCSADPGDTAIWSMPYSAEEVDEVARAKDRGVRVLVEIDGLVGTESTRRYMKQEAWKALGFKREAIPLIEKDFATINSPLLEAMRFADGLIVGSERLRGAYRDMNDNIHVLQSNIDPDDWPTDSPAKDPEVFRIGFAGSWSHIDDLPLVYDAFTWAAAQPGVEVLIIGDDPAETPSTTLVWRAYNRAREKVNAPRSEYDKEVWGLYRELEEHVRQWSAVGYRNVPWHNGAVQRYYRDLEQLDLGVCPISPVCAVGSAENGAHYRLDLKILEYAMAGALPVASRCPTFEGWEDLVPMTETRADFLEIVQWAVANRDEVRERAAAVREYVLAERTIERNLDAWRQALQLDPVAA